LVVLADFTTNIACWSCNPQGYNSAKKEIDQRVDPFASYQIF